MGGSTTSPPGGSWPLTPAVVLGNAGPVRGSEPSPGAPSEPRAEQAAGPRERAVPARGSESCETAPGKHSSAPREQPGRIRGGMRRFPAPPPPHCWSRGSRSRLLRRAFCEVRVHSLQPLNGLAGLRVSGGRPRPPRAPGARCPHPPRPHPDRRPAESPLPQPPRPYRPGGEPAEPAIRGRTPERWKCATATGAHQVRAVTSRAPDAEPPAGVSGGFG